MIHNDPGTAELKEQFKASLRQSLSKRSSIQSQQSVSEKFSVPGFARESRVESKFDGYEERLNYLEDKCASTV